MHPDCSYWINRLNLAPHPEGGYYRVTHIAPGYIETSSLSSSYGSARRYYTSIYYLLPAQHFSAFHRLQSDEIWHYCTGAVMEILIITATGELNRLYLGPDPDAGQSFQGRVPGGLWFAARPVDQNEQGYSLVTCFVAPGFDFADFTLGKRQLLQRIYPQHADVIAALTHD